MVGRIFCCPGIYNITMELIVSAILSCATLLQLKIFYRQLQTQTRTHIQDLRFKGSMLVDTCIWLDLFYAVTGRGQTKFSPSSQLVCFKWKFMSSFCVAECYLIWLIAILDNTSSHLGENIYLLTGKSCCGGQRLAGSDSFVWLDSNDGWEQ